MKLDRFYGSWAASFHCNWIGKFSWLKIILFAVSHSKMYVWCEREMDKRLFSINDKHLFTFRLTKNNGIAATIENSCPESKYRWQNQFQALRECFFLVVWRKLFLCWVSDANFQNVNAPTTSTISKKKIFFVRQTLARRVRDGERKRSKRTIENVLVTSVSNARLTNFQWDNLIG